MLSEQILAADHIAVEIGGDKVQTRPRHVFKMIPGTAEIGELENLVGTAEKLFILCFILRVGEAAGVLIERILIQIEGIAVNLCNLREAAGVNHAFLTVGAVKIAAQIADRFARTEGEDHEQRRHGVKVALHILLRIRIQFLHRIIGHGQIVDLGAVHVETGGKLRTVGYRDIAGSVQIGIGDVQCDAGFIERNGHGLLRKGGNARQRRQHQYGQNKRKNLFHENLLYINSAFVSLYRLPGQCQQLFSA